MAMRIGPGSACFFEGTRDIKGILKVENKTIIIIILLCECNVRVLHGLLPVVIADMSLVHYAILLSTLQQTKQTIHVLVPLAWGHDFLINRKRKKHLNYTYHLIRSGIELQGHNPFQTVVQPLKKKFSNQPRRSFYVAPHT